MIHVQVLVGGGKHCFYFKVNTLKEEVNDRKLKKTLSSVQDYLIYIDCVKFLCV